MQIERNVETRRSIIQHLTATKGVPFPDDVARYMAECIVTDSIRKLEGEIIRVIAYASLTDQTVTLSLAQEVVLAVGPDDYHQ